MNKVTLQKITITKNFGYITLIFLVSILVCKFVIFKNGVLIVNDVDFHYARAMSTIRALNDHQLIPQLDPSAAKGFGYSWNLFYGPFPTYLIAALFLITKNIAISINLISYIGVFLIGLAMYRYISYRTKSREAGFVSSLLMITSTSVLVNLYYYTGYGSLYALFFAILSLYGLQIILDGDKNFKGVNLLAIGGFGMLLSHSLTCLIMLLYIVCLLLFNFKAFFEKIKYFIYVALLSFGLSAYFLLPFIEVKQLNIYNQFNSDFLGYFMWKNPLILNSLRFSWKSMLFPKTFNVTNFPNVLLGLSLILLLVFLGKKGKENQNVNLKVSRIIIFFLFGLSTFVLCSFWVDWTKMPSILWTIQYPSRIMFYVSGITFSVFIGLTYGKLTNKLSPYWHCGMLVILMIISIGISQFSIEAKDNLFRANFNQSGSIDKNYDINGQQNLKTAIGEFFPTSIGTKNKTLSAIIDENQNVFWMANQYIYPNLEKRRAEGYLDLEQNKSAIINNLTTSGMRSKVSFNIKKTDGIKRIELPKIYYPGYKAYNVWNGKKENLNVQASKGGYVQINLPKGTQGMIVSYFGLSSASLLGLIITFITIGIMVIIIFLQKYSIRKRV
ncbi:hypothetical protein [Pseudolactococcus laudensis]|uniref:hypothetical protein n=1 Tax=Pseudolactococcus laudensis TaxID=1494461 RepID=UPI0012DFAEDA